MFVRQIPNKKTGRVAVAIVQSYREAETGKNKSRIVENLGFLDVLEKEHDDTIAWAKKKAADLTKLEKEKGKEYVLKASSKDSLDVSADKHALRKNIGYAALSYYYHKLGISEFIDNRRRRTKRQFNPNSAIKTLVYNRILDPDSKKGAWENRKMFFEDTNYSLDNAYSSLDFLLAHRDALLKNLHEKMRKLYHRDTLLLFYDVTNYFFEIDDNDADEKLKDGTVKEGLREKGCSKEHRTTPIVQMGLFMDEQGLPVSYELFSGNRHDSTTLVPMIEESFDKFNMSHMIIVADKGMMGGDNLRKIILEHKGYIISNSVRKADAAFISYIKEDKEYSELYDEETGILEFKYKSRTVPRYIKVTDEQTGGKTAVKINEHQIVLWSRKYAEREKKNRDKILEKTKKLASTKSQDAKILSFGSRKYIKKDPVDAKGNPIKIKDYVLSLDESKVNEEEELDGYYVICTNVCGIHKYGRPFKDGQKCRFSVSDNFLELNRELNDLEIVDMYHGLWRIEETFKVTKTDLVSRPVYVWTENRIRAHFLICFISLLLMRVLQYDLNWKYSASSIKESLAAANGTLVGENLYAFNLYDEVLKDIGEKLDLDFSKRFMTQGQIKSLVASTKNIS